jgi:hypothetical protein
MSDATEGKWAIAAADCLASARYCADLEQVGDFWHGRAVVRVGDRSRQFTGEAVMRSPERAIGAALREVGAALLAAYPPFKPEVKT